MARIESGKSARQRVAAAGSCWQRSADPEAVALSDTVASPVQAARRLYPFF